MAHLCCEDFNAQLDYQQEANWCQVFLNRSGWQYSTDAMISKWLELKIAVCRDAEHVWTLRFHCSGAEPEWPLCEWPSPPWRSKVWGPVINKRCNVVTLLGQFGHRMPVEENTGSTHGKHILTPPVMLKDSCLIKAASASEAALVRWCAASDIPVSFL